MSIWRELPARISALRDLALDLRWTWSHQSDALWERVDADLWERSRNPWAVLEDVSELRLMQLASDDAFLEHLDECIADRREYLDSSGWFPATYGTDTLKGVAYFSMEFGLGDALPLYAGGLGILAGDFLKTASDLGIPVIGIGLLFQEGYFRQTIDGSGQQCEAYPYNEPAMMPIEPVPAPEGGRLHIVLNLPGRRLRLRVWRAAIGRTSLYLLDSNDPLNTPADRGITGALYGGGTQMRLLQEIVLGIGGWRLVEAICPHVQVCHMNEGHAAFAVVERARSFASRTGVSFREGLWATRAGNIFTTHTPVAAGFDRFLRDLLEQYRSLLVRFGIDPAEVAALGRADEDDATAPMNMAYVAARGSSVSLAVSSRHGAVSRRIFQPLFPRWPEREVPIGHVTNGVHVPTWDSAAADRIWTNACGKERWRTMSEDLAPAAAALSDHALWTMRAEARRELISSVRTRLKRHLDTRGVPPESAALAENVLDANVLTLGFARRFTAYKRPNLLLRDPDRLVRLLCNEERPVQIVLAGKAHPADMEGKRLIGEWVALAQSPELRNRIVFLEDYDVSLAQELVRGVDVWINTPRPPWEACGTSGMKILVNGGLHLSVLDGWWEEAYTPGLGWALAGDPQADDAKQDAQDADAIFAILEDEVAPSFYARDESGLPLKWIERIRRSMAELTPRYSSIRMAREYLERAYIPAAKAVARRMADGGQLAKDMLAWETRLRRNWKDIHIAQPTFLRDNNIWAVSVAVYLGDISPDDICVELYADPSAGHEETKQGLTRSTRVSGTTNGYLYTGNVGATRRPEDYTVRAIPYHPDVRVPAELPMIVWQK